MFTTANLPATMRPDPARPHVCGHPGCPLRPENAAPERPRTGASNGR